MNLGVYLLRGLGNYQEWCEMEEEKTSSSMLVQAMAQVLS